jgi:hypothetical protein
MTGTVGWMEQLSSPTMVLENQQSSQADTSDDTSDDPAMFMPNPQPVWPWVWPGL